MSEFTAVKSVEGITTYTLKSDPRFSIHADTKRRTLGTGDMVFGQVIYGDGGLSVTGWYVRVEGSPSRFSMGRKLADRKAQVLNAEWREWAISRIPQS